jgi:protein-L-isoaspartate(D-aspartate) O-methyltransferase
VAGDCALERELMVEEQLRQRGITDSRVLATFLAVERHLFVPENLRAHAYCDFPVAIGEGQTISQPYIVALMTEKLVLGKGQKVLEIGSGSGYQSAILAELGCSVYSIEYLRALADRARLLLAQLGYVSVSVKNADGTLGWPEEAPFNRILVAAACPDIPDPLLEQLARGGTMVLPLGGQHTQVLTLVEKKDSGIDTADICECSFVPLKGKYGWKN